MARAYWVVWLLAGCSDLPEPAVPDLSAPTDLAGPLSCTLSPPSVLGHASFEATVRALAPTIGGVGAVLSQTPFDRPGTDILLAPPGSDGVPTAPFVARSDVPLYNAAVDQGGAAIAESTDPALTSNGGVDLELLDWTGAARAPVIHAMPCCAAGFGSVSGGDGVMLALGGDQNWNTLISYAGNGVMRGSTKLSDGNGLNMPLVWDGTRFLALIGGPPGPLDFQVWALANVSQSTMLAQLTIHSPLQATALLGGGGRFGMAWGSFSVANEQIHSVIHEQWLPSGADTTVDELDSRRPSVMSAGIGPSAMVVEYLQQNAAGAFDVVLAVIDTQNRLVEKFVIADSADGGRAGQVIYSIAPLGDDFVLVGARDNGSEGDFLLRRLDCM